MLNETYLMRPIEKVGHVEVRARKDRLNEGASLSCGPPAGGILYCYVVTSSCLCFPRKLHCSSNQHFIVFKVREKVLFDLQLFKGSGFDYGYRRKYSTADGYHATCYRCRVRIFFAVLLLFCETRQMHLHDETVLF